MEKTKFVEKVWGSEEWRANTEKYCGKILTLKPGFSCSYHYHKNKDETFSVLDGKVYLLLEGEEMVLNEGDSQRILPGQKHKFASLQGLSRLLEISTHHEESDSYREMESGPIDVVVLRKRLGV